jgi:hypothetical protein
LNDDLILVIDRIIRRYRFRWNWARNAYFREGRMCLVGAMECYATGPQLSRLRPYVLRAIAEQTGTVFRTIEDFNDGCRHVSQVRAVLAATRSLLIEGPLPLIEPVQVNAMDQLRAIVAGVFAEEPTDAIRRD